MELKIYNNVVKRKVGLITQKRVQKICPLVDLSDYDLEYMDFMIKSIVHYY